MPDLSSWSDAALSAELLECSARVERAQAEQLAVAAEWQARRAWAADGASSAVSWLTAHAAMTRPAGARLCRAARLLHAHEQTATALEAGEVTVAHVEVLATAVKRREELYREHEQTLLDTARLLIPEDLVAASRRWRELADDELASLDAASSYANRYLHVSPTLGGARIDGFLDPVGAATVISALDALSPPDPASDPAARSHSVRYADAFVLLAQQAMADPERAAGSTAGVELAIDVDTLLGVSTDACTARCDLTGYGPIARAVALRLACDPKLARVVMQGKSRVLDLGRSTRVVSPALRKAVMLRDRHCQGRHCRVPAKWCDVHHVVHWLDGGETKEENLILLCRRHHVDHHEGGWRMSRELDGTVTSRRVRLQRVRNRRRSQSRPP